MFREPPFQRFHLIRFLAEEALDNLNIGLIQGWRVHGNQAQHFDSAM